MWMWCYNSNCTLIYKSVLKSLRNTNKCLLNLTHHRKECCSQSWLCALRAKLILLSASWMSAIFRQYFILCWMRWNHAQHNCQWSIKCHDSTWKICMQFNLASFLWRHITACVSHKNMTIHLKPPMARMYPTEISKNFYFFFLSHLRVLLCEHS